MTVTKGTNISEAEQKATLDGTELFPISDGSKKPVTVTANTLKGFVGGGGGGGSTTVVDNLDSTSPTDALSANQGHIIGERVTDLEQKVEGIDTDVTEDDAEEQVWESNDESERYASIGHYGVKAEAFRNLEGKDITRGVADYASFSWIDDDFVLAAIPNVLSICENTGIKCSFAVVPDSDEVQIPSSDSFTQKFTPSRLAKIKEILGQGYPIEVHPIHVG